jgi:hypothetical protein
MIRLPFPQVDGGDMPADYREILRPGETLKDRDGHKRVLPRQYLRIDSWETALNTQITPHFMAWELISVDVREAPPMRSFPRYVPCALLLLATALELFRMEAGTYVHVAANGGYRSPGHSLSRLASRHCWGTAANIYRVGDDFLDTRAAIEKYAAIARRVMPGVWIRPFGTSDGEVDDHLHLDLGYTTFEPLDRKQGEEGSSQK